ncbi:MAG: NAD-dependent epimerase/dehydratase family protein [Ferruginibacter sp.]
MQKGNHTQTSVLTRGKTITCGDINCINWDAKHLSNWVSILEGSTAIINLVGKSVNCRSTKNNKREIIESRVDATIAIGKAISTLANPPKAWINAGSAAIFGDAKGEIKDKYSFPCMGFSAEVCE